MKKPDEDLYNSSLNNLKKALQINPNKTLVYYELAKIYYTLSKEDDLEVYSLNEFFKRHDWLKNVKLD